MLNLSPVFPRMWRKIFSMSRKTLAQKFPGCFYVFFAGVFFFSATTRPLFLFAIFQSSAENIFLFDERDYWFPCCGVCARFLFSRRPVPKIAEFKNSPEQWSAKFFYSLFSPSLPASFCSISSIFVYRLCSISVCNYFRRFPLNYFCEIDLDNRLSIQKYFIFDQHTRKFINKNNIFTLKIDDLS